MKIQLDLQLSLFLENKPGTLARVCEALEKEHINIFAIATSDTTDHSVVRLVVSHPRKAIHLFEDHGTMVVENEVILIEGDNQPGSLARIAKKLSAARVNIEYCYCATGSKDKRGLLVLRPSNARKALKALNS